MSGRAVCFLVGALTQHSGVNASSARMYPIMSEGMFPYAIYYVLATDEEIQRLSDSAAIGW